MSCPHSIPDPSWCVLCKRQREPEITIPLPTTKARWSNRCPGCGDEIAIGDDIYQIPDDGVLGTDLEPLELQGAWVDRECAIQHAELARIGEQS